MQGRALNQRVGKQRRTQGFHALPADAAPCAAQIAPLQHTVREHYRRFTTIQIHFSHHHPLLAPGIDQRHLVPARIVKPLVHRAHAESRAARLQAARERTTVGQPATIRALSIDRAWLPGVVQKFHNGLIRGFLHPQIVFPAAQPALQVQLNRLREFLEHAFCGVARRLQ